MLSGRGGRSGEDPGPVDGEAAELRDPRLGGQPVLLSLHPQPLHRHLQLLPADPLSLRPPGRSPG